MTKLAVLLLDAGGILLLSGGCSTDKSQPPAETKTAEEATPRTEEKVAGMTAPAAETPGDGDELFKTHCVKCHKNGGNIINRQKGIGRAELAARNITTPEDIISVMRNPGKGMTRFAEDKIPDDDARKIGEYILETFE